MTIANSAQHTLYLDTEDAYGVQNTPQLEVNLLEVPHTGCSFNLSKSTLESELIDGSRNVAFLRHGNKTVGGEFTGEFGKSVTYDILIAALLGGTYSGNVVKVASTVKSFTFERNFTDITTGDYHYYRGMMVNSMSLSVAPDALVNVTFGFVGQSLAVVDVPVPNTTKAAELAAYVPYDSFTAVLKEGGNAIATVTALDFTIENGLESSFVIADAETLQPDLKKCRVSGSLTAFFESDALYSKFLDETPSSIDILFTDGSKTSFFDFPSVKYTSGQTDVSGEGSITVSMDWTATYNSSDATSVIFDKGA